MMMDYEEWSSQIDTISEAIRTRSSEPAIPDSEMEESSKQPPDPPGTGDPDKPPDPEEEEEEQQEEDQEEAEERSLRKVRERKLRKKSLRKARERKLRKKRKRKNPFNRWSLNQPRKVARLRNEKRRLMRPQSPDFHILCQIRDLYIKEP